MDESLEQLYQEIILEASKHPHGKVSFETLEKSREDADNTETMDHIGGLSAELHGDHGCSFGQSHQFNPTCGDDVRVQVELSSSQDHHIESLVWDGYGCSICTASLSIMVDLVTHLPLQEALRIDQYFHELMHTKGQPLSQDKMDCLEDAAVFEQVAKYPMRVKCALLGWEGFRDSVARALAVKSNQNE